MNAPFEITKEEVLNLAAQKVADAALMDDDKMLESANKLIRERVESVVAHGLNSRVDKFLTDEMEKLVGKEFTPVNLWGEEAGKPTTIRDAIAQRSKLFWETKVDDNGKEATWNGVPRYERLVKQIATEQFNEAIKQNATVIVEEFKKALLADSTRLAAEHIDKLIPKRR